MSSYIKELITIYTTTRLVKIRSPFIAIINTVLVILVWCSFLGSLRLDIRKVYQSTCPVRGVVLSKVKGFASTENLTDEDLAIDQPELYRREWDPPDIVFPAQGGEGETGSFTIVTNLVITPNQTLSTCAEESGPISKCNQDSDCKKGYWSAGTHGVFTGKCLVSNRTCEIKGWCPIEMGTMPRRGKKPLLEDVKDFTVMLKNSFEFPDCGDKLQGRNLPNHLTQAYLRNCTYHKVKDPLCPIFKIGDIIQWSGDNFSRVAVKGGVFRIKITWECDFDFGRTVQDCMPKYDFVRVDDKEAGVSKGWNFRSANFYSEDRRTLKKQFGMKILINLEGEGKQFSFFLLGVTVGSVIGLFSVAPLACDFLLDVFNLLSSSSKCGTSFKIFHDNTMSRYEESETEKTSASYDTRNGANLHGLDNKGLSSSSVSINNETFKRIPE